MPRQHQVWESQEYLQWVRVGKLGNQTIMLLYWFANTEPCSIPPSNRWTLNKECSQRFLPLKLRNLYERCTLRPPPTDWPARFRARWVNIQYLLTIFLFLCQGVWANMSACQSVSRRRSEDDPFPMGFWCMRPLKLSSLQVQFLPHSTSLQALGIQSNFALCLNF